jgi:hypothetical protein
VTNSELFFAGYFAGLGLIMAYYVVKFIDAAMTQLLRSLAASI